MQVEHGKHRACSSCWHRRTFDPCPASTRLVRSMCSSSKGWESTSFEECSCRSVRAQPPFRSREVHVAAPTHASHAPATEQDHLWTRNESSTRSMAVVNQFGTAAQGRGNKLGRRPWTAGRNPMPCRRSNIEGRKLETSGGREGARETRRLVIRECIEREQQGRVMHRA